MTLLVPLYVHPAADPEAWGLVAAAGPRVYGVVLNPGDGPGAAPDPAFAAATRTLRAAGTLVLGYVDLDYGMRPESAVTGDLDRHRDWYGPDGCFFDQVPADRSALPGCRRLVRAARQRGAGTVVLNHGVHPAPGFARIADLLVTFEGPWPVYLSSFTRPRWTARHPPERFCHLVYEVPTALAGVAARAAGERGAAVSCAVTGSLPNPWGSPPPALYGGAR